LQLYWPSGSPIHFSISGVTAPAPRPPRCGTLGPAPGSTSGHPGRIASGVFCQLDGWCTLAARIGWPSFGRTYAQRTGSCADVAEAVLSSLDLGGGVQSQGRDLVRLPPVTPCPTPAPTQVEEMKPAPVPHLRFDVDLGLLASIAGGQAVPPVPRSQRRLSPAQMDTLALRSRFRQARPIPNPSDR